MKEEETIMAFKDMRDFLNRLEKGKDLIEIEEEVDPKFEVAAMLREVGLEDGPVLFFKKIKGYSVPVVGNFLGSYRRMAMAFDTTIERLPEEYLRRKRGSIPPMLVDWGPCKEVIIKDNIDLLKVAPIMTYHKNDAGPYITSAATIAKDLDTGTLSMGLHRIQVHSGQKMTVLLATPPLSEFLARAEERGKPLEVAVAVGMEPILVFSSVIWTPDRPAKFDIAGALRREPVPLVKAETVDVEVPAHAELIIEGIIKPGVRMKDGPFGESTGYYLAYDAPVIDITAITHRKDYIFHALCPWVLEDDILMVISIGREIFKQIRTIVPSVKDMTFAPGTVALHTIISMEKYRPGDVKRALLLALLINPLIKRAVAVDTDVDIYNPREVEWAIATRSQPDRDMIMIKDVPGLAIDPSAGPGPDYLSTKIGIDATKYAGKEKEFEKIQVPEECSKMAKEILARYGWKSSTRFIV